jgi:hypothetical protein
LALGILAGLGACDYGNGPRPGPGPDDSLCGHVDSASGVVLVTHGDTLVDNFGGVFQAGPPNRIQVRAGGLVHAIETRFLDDAAAPISIAQDCTVNKLGFTLGNPDLAAISQDLGLGQQFNLQGLRPGTTTLRIALVHESHAHYESPDIPVEVLPAAP